MRGTCGCLCVLFLPWATASAEPPALLPSDSPHATVEQLPVTPITLPEEKETATGQQHAIDAQFLLGFPTGLRLQAAVDRQERRTWVAEVFAGWELFNPLLGVGGRVLFTPAAGRHSDFLVVGPGVDFFVDLRDRSGFWFSGTRTGYFLVPDVEVAWLHDFDAHFGWELGLDLGLGVAVWEGDRYNSPRVSVLPLLSVFTGFNF